MVSRELQECTNVFIFFNSKMGKKEREICNDDIISERPGLRMGMDFRRQV